VHTQVEQLVKFKGILGRWLGLLADDDEAGA
jgi:hypothetical protein